MSKRIFVLAHHEARRRAMAAVSEAPDGHVVEVREPRRSLDQNAMLWPLLEAFSEQLTWPVNGERVKLEADEWKDLLSAAFRQESPRVAMGMYGGMVLLGMRTSKMTKRQFSEFIEFILSEAANRGVNVEPTKDVRKFEEAEA